MIYEETVKNLKRYTFLNDVFIKIPFVYFKYNVKGKEKTKRLAIRATSEQLQRTILSIKKEIGFDLKKIERDEEVIRELKKPMMFVDR